MKNPFHILSDKHPKIWASVVFVPFAFITVVVTPILFVCSLIWDAPRVLGNLWDDIRGTTKGLIRDYGRAIKWTWSDWWEAARERTGSDE